MLDVHMPEKPIHGVREFFLHLFTITIGLLIALGLENVAEWRHHVHLRNEADANIVSEIRDNQHELADVLRATSGEAANLQKVLVMLDAKQHNQSSNLSHLSLGMELGTMRDASWQTANSTGALSYMEYSHVKGYSAAYTLQNQFVQLQSQGLNSFLQLQSFLVAGADPRAMSPEDAARTRINVEQTLAYVMAMRDIGRGLQKAYVDALKQ